MGEKEQWYTNKELFEKIEGLSKELTRTQTLVSKYNGLREKVDEYCVKVDAIIHEGAGKNKLASGVSWTIGIVGALIGIAGGILAVASKL